MDKQMPTLKTERLTLRPFVESDIAQHFRLINDPKIAATTGRIPHPYKVEFSRDWILSLYKRYQDRLSLTLAVTLEDNVVGTMALSDLFNVHLRANLTFWIGSEYWGMGYASEAATAIISFGFSELKLNRVYGQCFSENSASAKVLLNSGMAYEGRMREGFFKGGKFHDLLLYAVLRSDWPVRHRARSTANVQLPG